MKTNMLRRLANKKLRKWYLVLSLVIIFSGISSLFWFNELVYQLPTPIPSKYKEIRPGTPIAVAPELKANPKKPLFLHFFNPDCPCSRFNIGHFKSLVKKYHSDLDFAIVAMVKENRYTAKAIQDKFDVELPVSFDTSLASTCGVYSTPQAVIIDKEKLYFRGNYNKSRYCTDPASNFAQMAIDSLLRQKYQLNFEPVAFRAYGCELPTCKK